MGGRRAAESSVHPVMDLGREPTRPSTWYERSEVYRLAKRIEPRLDQRV